MNNSKILLISETYVKNHSTVMQNVEDKFIQSHIFESQDIHLQNILGSPLYSNIINEFVTYKDAVATGYTGSVSTIVSAINVTLVDDYISPTLLYYTLYESIMDLSLKFTNKGLVQQSSPENSTIPDIAYFNMRRKDFKDKAEYYAQRLMTYLIANQDTYTIYRDWTTGQDVSTISPTRNNYFCGMFLGNSKKGTTGYENINTPGGARCI